jgi:hypothetical protein
MLCRIVPWEARTATFWVSRPSTSRAKSPTRGNAAGAVPLTGPKYRLRYSEVAGDAPIQDEPS